MVKAHPFFKKLWRLYPLRQPKAARDKGFEMTVPKEVPNEEKKQPEQFYRPDESARKELARRWIAQARGKATPALGDIREE